MYISVFMSLMRRILGRHLSVMQGVVVVVVAGDEGLPTHRGWGPLHWESAWQVSLESPSSL